MKMMREDALLLVVLAAIVLVAAAGLCVLDLDGAHAAGIDLCLSVVVVAGVPLLLIFPAAPGRLVPVRVSAGPLTSLAPPPKG